MELIPKTTDFKKKVEDSFKRQKFMGLLRASLTEIQPGFCEIQVPYAEHLTQQHGFFHAGIVGSVADTAAGYASFSLMDYNSTIFTVEFKINLLAPADGDLLIGRAQVLKHGKTLTICRSEVLIQKDGKEKLCAAAQSTLIELRDKSDKSVD